eukprot:g3335.t1
MRRLLKEYGLPVDDKWTHDELIGKLLSSEKFQREQMKVAEGKAQMQDKKQDTKQAQATTRRIKVKKAILKRKPQLAKNARARKDAAKTGGKAQTKRDKKQDKGKADVEVENEDDDDVDEEVGDQGDDDGADKVIKPNKKAQAKRTAKNAKKRNKSDSGESQGSEVTAEDVEEAKQIEKQLKNIRKGSKRKQSADEAEADEAEAYTDNALQSVQSVLDKYKYKGRLAKASKNAAKQAKQAAEPEERADEPAEAQQGEDGEGADAVQSVLNNPALKGKKLQEALQKLPAAALKEKLGQLGEAKNGRNKAELAQRLANASKNAAKQAKQTAEAGAAAGVDEEHPEDHEAEPAAVADAQEGDEGGEAEVDVDSVLRKGLTPKKLEKALQKLKGPALKKKLEELGLVQKGNKAEMAERLAKASKNAAKQAKQTAVEAGAAAGVDEEHPEDHEAESAAEAQEGDEGGEAEDVDSVLRKGLTPKKLEKALQKLKGPALKEKLGELGLVQKGNKAEMAERLAKASKNAAKQAKQTAVEAGAAAGVDEEHPEDHEAESAAEAQEGDEGGEAEDVDSVLRKGLTPKKLEKALQKLKGPALKEKLGELGLAAAAGVDEVEVPPEEEVWSEEPAEAKDEQDGEPETMDSVLASGKKGKTLEKALQQLDLKKPVLVAKLGELGEPTTGNKAALITRLATAVTKQAKQAAKAAAAGVVEGPGAAEEEVWSEDEEPAEGQGQGEGHGAADEQEEQDPESEVAEDLNTIKTAELISRLQRRGIKLSPKMKRNRSLLVAGLERSIAAGEEDLMALKTADLKKELKQQFGLPTGGKKQELVDRLAEARRSAAVIEPPGGPEAGAEVGMEVDGQAEDELQELPGGDGLFRLRLYGKRSPLFEKKLQEMKRPKELKAFFKAAFGTKLLRDTEKKWKEVEPERDGSQDQTSEEQSLPWWGEQRWWRDQLRDTLQRGFKDLSDLKVPGLRKLAKDSGVKVVGLKGLKEPEKRQKLVDLIQEDYAANKMASPMDIDDHMKEVASPSLPTTLGENDPEADMIRKRWNAYSRQGEDGSAAPQQEQSSVLQMIDHLDPYAGAEGEASRPSPLQTLFAEKLLGGAGAETAAASSTRSIQSLILGPSANPFLPWSEAAALDEAVRNGAKHAEYANGKRVAEEVCTKHWGAVQGLAPFTECLQLRRSLAEDFEFWNGEKNWMEQRSGGQKTEDVQSRIEYGVEKGFIRRLLVHHGTGTGKTMTQVRIRSALARKWLRSVEQKWIDVRAEAYDPASERAHKRHALPDVENYNIDGHKVFEKFKGFANPESPSLAEIQVLKREFVDFHLNTIKRSEEIIIFKNPLKMGLANGKQKPNGKQYRAQALMTYAEQSHAQELLQQFLQMPSSWRTEFLLQAMNNRKNGVLNLVLNLFEDDHFVTIVNGYTAAEAELAELEKILVKDGSEKQAKYKHEHESGLEVRPLRLDRKWQLKSAYKNLVKKAEIPATKQNGEDKELREIPVEDGVLRSKPITVTAATYLGLMHALADPNMGPYRTFVYWSFLKIAGPDGVNIASNGGRNEYWNQVTGLRQDGKGAAKQLKEIPGGKLQFPIDDGKRLTGPLHAGS